MAQSLNTICAGLISGLAGVDWMAVVTVGLQSIGSSLLGDGTDGHPPWFPHVEVVEAEALVTQGIIHNPPPFSFF